MTDNKKQIELLKKLKALAERGDGGEKQNAQAQLERLMRQYGITEDELVEDLVKDHEFKYKENSYFSKKLVFQIAYTVYGNVNSDKGIFSYCAKNKSRLCIRCTDAEFIEIVARYEFFRRIYDDQLDLFNQSFIQAQNLFPPHSLIKPSEGKDCLTERDKKVLLMTTGIEKQEYMKQLTGGGK